MSKKYTYEIVKEIIVNFGYELLSDKYISYTGKLKIKDSEGYKYLLAFTNILLNNKNDSPPERFDSCNPYTIENIRNWCKINKTPFFLVSCEWKGREKLKWQCLKDGCGEIFEASWNNTSRGQGCGFCHGKQVGLSNCLATIYPHLIDEWDYEKNNDLHPWNVASSSNMDVYWICEKGHEWEAKISNRGARGDGCTECSKDSKGELKIQDKLDNYNFYYNPQYKFENCRNKNRLPFDFMIFKNEIKTTENILLACEYDGLQHFQPVNFNGIDDKRAEDNFKITQNHDRIKNNYCINNRIPLLRIPYWEFDNIEEILIDVLINKNMDNKFFIHNQTPKEIVS